jgi:hypothetical protein
MVSSNLRRIATSRWLDIAFPPDQQEDVIARTLANGTASAERS